MSKDFQNFDNRVELSTNDYIRKPKKFVFHINPENIQTIENLQFDEKHELINKLLTNYREGFDYSDRAQKEAQKARIIFITSICTIIIIPVLFLFIKASFDMSNSSSNYMKKNFEKLYEN